MNLASLPGVVVDGKYRIERQLGKGGMGAVFQATHLGTTRTVAVKVIVPQFAGEDEFLLRFQREAEAAGRLRHPNVVNVTDFGSTVVNGSQLAYLVMEFLDGSNLGDYLQQNPRPATDEILDIVDQVALALSAAHESGIVHRDLKPDNIWLQPNHRGGFNVKVLDFGIAKLHNPAGGGPSDPVAERTTASITGVTPVARDSRESETVIIAPETGSGDGETMITLASTRPTPVSSGTLGASQATRLETTVGSVLGTPAYMAPEQCRGTNVEAGADIYSLAVIIYQMFCGCLPFESTNLKELLRKQIEEAPLAPAERDPGIPARVSRVILSGLAKDPACRPSSAIGFASQLRAASEGEVKLLADGKIVAGNQGKSLFPMLLACFAPQIPAVAVLYVAGRALVARGAIPAGAFILGLQFCLIAIPYFLSQCYKAGATLLIEEARAAGHFGMNWRPPFRKLRDNFFSLAGTHLRNAVDLRPASFFSSQLWSVVWASEGLSGRAALDRAALLARVAPSAAAALAVRQWAVVLLPALFVPAIVSIMGGSFDDNARLMTGTDSTFMWFTIVYPVFLTVMLYRFFGPPFFFLYLSARRCLAEAVDAHIPSATRRRRSRRAAPVRVGTILWMVVPLLLIAFIVYRALPGGSAVRNLLSASEDGRVAEVRRALDSGLSANSSDFRGWTPLLNAAERGNLVLIRLLLAHHSDVNARTKGGDTPLLLAAWNGRPEAAELLIAGGADVNAEDSDGRTPLFGAAIHGDAALCRLLLSKGADPRHRDRAGKTARDYAREESHDEIAGLLSDK